MVGEIRDGETANLAVQAALTGHLVFSTLHTNNAATCLPRLLDMGIEPFLIASTVRAVVGQRLVRKLVPDSVEPFEVDMNTQARIQNSFGIKGPEDIARIHKLEADAIKAKIGDSEPATDEKSIKRLWRIKGGSSVSYRGRIGIYEVLPMSSDIQKLIIARYSADHLQEQAIKEGMVTMQTDGLIKALRGQTTLEEVMRVTSER